MSDDKTAQANEDEQQRDDDRAEAGPPEDVEEDPAYNPDDPGLKAAKGA
jgi:hypothetical protein